MGVTSRKQTWWARWLIILLAGLGVENGATIYAQATSTVPPAPVVHDEGGAVAVRGKVTYTDPLFMVGTAEPMVILEDQAGFVDRNNAFLMPTASQVLGQITSDYATSPFSYTIALPLEPQASLRDVDHNNQVNRGVMVYAVAYWTNIFGDPFLEARDLLGGGWSTAYASTRISEAGDNRREVIGGKYLVYAPDDQQGFPSSFGADQRLFTADDPIVRLPQGYTVVNMDTTPFTFDRSRYPVIDLIEPPEAALNDFSNLSYSQAFDALIGLLRKKYAFTDYKHIDWERLHTTYRPRFVQAEQSQDKTAYLRALSDFAFEIPDAHISGPFVSEDFQRMTGGGLGVALAELDDGRILVTHLLPDGPAAKAGLQLRAEIVAINDKPAAQAVAATFAWSGPFSTEQAKRLQQLRYVLRAPIGATFSLTYQNPQAPMTQTVTLQTIAETESLNFTATDKGLTGFETPVEYKRLDNGLGYVKIYSFADNDRLSILLWERLMQALNDQRAPGLIIDMRQNSGGNGFLADQMAAYFFDQPLDLGNTGYYDEQLHNFYFDPRAADRYILPTSALRYHGKLAVLIGPNCKSACEFFSYDLTLQKRAAIVGQYATAGAGGSVAELKMPSNQFFRFTIGRAVDPNGQIHVEGKGVVPTVHVPVDEATVFGGGDPVLEAAVQYLKTGKAP